MNGATEARMTPLPEEGHLLRIFIGESDKQDGMPLFEWIVQQARQHGLAGATVLRGITGFGAHSRIHSAKILQLSEDLPIVIEIVDSQDKIDAFVPVLDGMMSSGLVTLEKVQVLQYGKPKSVGST